MATWKSTAKNMERSSNLWIFLIVSLVLHLGLFLPVFMTNSEIQNGGPSGGSLESFEVISVAKSPVHSNVKSSKSGSGLSGKGEGSGTIQPPKLLAASPLQYPEAARQQGREGEVVAILSISDLGTVEDVEIISATDPDFAKVAEKGLRSYRFQPAMSENRAQAVKIRYRYHFQMKND